MPAVLIIGILYLMRKFLIILLLCVQALQISWASAYGVAGEQSLAHELQHVVEGTDHHDPSAHPLSDSGCSDCCVAHVCHGSGLPFASSLNSFSLNLQSSDLFTVDRYHHSRDFSGRIERPKWSAA